MQGWSGNDIEEDRSLSERYIEGRWDKFEKLDWSRPESLEVVIVATHNCTEITEGPRDIM
jgi:hypothetical protein